MHRYKSVKEEVKYIKGSCFWFTRNNPDDKRIKMCKDGSLCRFLHLTGEETREMCNDWEALTDCPSCVYKSSPFPEGLEGHEYIQEKIRREIPCFNKCRNGKVLKRNLIISNSRKRCWCNCSLENKKEFGSSLYSNYSHPSGEKDAWICNNCKGMTQVG